MAGSFSISLSRFADKANGQIKQAVQKIAMETFSRVIYRTPVDTGRLRANWGAQVGNPYSGTAQTFDKEGNATVAKAQNVVKGWSGQGSVYLCNNLSYASVMEYGRANGQPGSMQSPQGMVRVTLAEMQSGYAEKAAR